MSMRLSINYFINQIYLALVFTVKIISNKQYFPHDYLMMNLYRRICRVSKLPTVKCKEIN